MRYIPDFDNERYYLRCDRKEFSLLKELVEDRALRETNLKIIQTTVHILDKIEREIESVEEKIREEEKGHKKPQKDPFDVKVPDDLDPGFLIDSEPTDDDCTCFEKEND